MEDLVDVSLQMLELLVCNFFYFGLFISLQKTIQNPHQRLNQVPIAGCYNLFAINS